MEEESPFGLTKAAQLLDAFEEAWNFHSVQRLYLGAMLFKAKQVDATKTPFASREQIFGEDQSWHINGFLQEMKESGLVPIQERERQLGVRQNEHAERLAAAFGCWSLRDPAHPLLVREQGISAFLLSAAADCCGCTHWLKHPLNDQRDQRIRKIAADLTPGDTVGCEAQSCALLVFIEERYPALKADLVRVLGYDHYAVKLGDVVLDPVMMTCYPLSKVKEAVVFFEAKEQCNAIYRLAEESWVDEEARGTLVVVGRLVLSRACKESETPTVTAQPRAAR